jgi:hypothetical protein
MDQIFEKYVNFFKKATDDDDDDDMIHYQKVQVTKDFTKNGPFAGEKYYDVIFNNMTGDVIFNLKSGGCRMISISSDGSIKYMGERKGGRENIEGDDTYIPTDPKTCKTSLKFS